MTTSSDAGDPRPGGASPQNVPGPSGTRHDLVLPGIRFSAVRWSPPADAESDGRHLVILHGVTGNAMAWDGVGMALARQGCTVDALDLPGHGQTRWTDGDGRPVPDQESVGADRYELHRVGELVARAIHALPTLPPGAGTASPPAPPSILGHSWGAGVAVMAIDAGAPVARLVLLDPPFMTPAQGAEMAASFAAELRPGMDLDAARALVREQGDRGESVEARAHAIVETSPLAAGAIARGGPWDPMEVMAAWRARHPGLPVDVIAGDPSAGGMIPPQILRLLRTALGPSHVHEMPGVGHSPYREDLQRFMQVLGEALGDVPGQAPGRAPDWLARRDDRITSARS
jgi:pimeloyl-ACP methyl ester carboxylesterase